MENLFKKIKKKTTKNHHNLHKHAHTYYIHNNNYFITIFYCLIIDIV